MQVNSQTTVNADKQACCQRSRSRSERRHASRVWGFNIVRDGWTWTSVLMTQPGRRMFSVAKDWEELFENVEPGRRIARKTWIEEIPKNQVRMKSGVRSLYLHDGNEVENRVSGMKKYMLAKSRCIFMLRVIEA